MNKLLVVIIIFTVFLSSCQKSNGISNATTDQSVIDSDVKFYFRGAINGVSKDWTVVDYKNGDNLEFRYNAASARDSLGNDCVNTFCKYMIEDADIFQNNGSGSTKNYIAVGFNISSKSGDRSEIISQFSPGEKTFGKRRVTINDSVHDGVYVYYIDENGKEWCSDFGSGIQSESIFKIEELLPQPFTEINCRNIWKASFSCILYDHEGYFIRLDNCELFTPILVKK